MKFTRQIILALILFNFMGLFSLFGQQSPKMKTISYRGGIVEFRIPVSWKEEYSDTDGGAFYEDKPDSGTFRIKVITLKSAPNTNGNSPVQVLNSLAGSLKLPQGKSEQLSENVALFQYEQSNIDRGQSIKIIYWVIANTIPPSHARIVTFSYTILANQEQNSQTKEEVKMLDGEVRTSKFATTTGN